MWSLSGDKLKCIIGGMLIGGITKGNGEKKTVFVNGLSVLT